MFLLTLMVPSDVRGHTAVLDSLKYTVLPFATATCTHPVLPPFTYTPNVVFEFVSHSPLTVAPPAGDCSRKLLQSGIVVEVDVVVLVEVVVDVEVVEVEVDVVEVEVEVVDVEVVVLVDVVVDVEVVDVVVDVEVVDVEVVVLVEVVVDVEVVDVLVEVVEVVVDVEVVEVEVVDVLVLEYMVLVETAVLNVAVIEALERSTKVAGSAVNGLSVDGPALIAHDSKACPVGDTA